jgi:rubrerythrin
MSNPKKPTDLGQNRTGMGMSPIDGKRVVEGALAGTPARSFDVSPIEAVRIDESQQAEPVGTLPPPPTLKGMAKAGMQAIKGNNPNVLIDLLSDRLAFERTGVRLYEALLAKQAASHDHVGGPSREDLEQIRDDELKHVGLLVQAIETLGADPTVVSPTADVSAVASLGIVQVVTDPRATLTHGLHAIHMAELVDTDSWLVLADLADRMGHDDLAAGFRQALAEEELHLARVRAWLTTAIDLQAGIEPRAVVSAPIAPLP